MKQKEYAGIDQEASGSMTPISKIIRDAWVFEIIPETETCKGWNFSRVDALLKQVDTEWDKYGCLVSHLPEPLRERHNRIHGAAFTQAKAAGWSGDLESEDE